MFHRVLQLIKTEYVHVEVMSALIKISVENMDKVVLSLILRMSESTRSDRLSVGDSVESVLIRKLCDGVQGSEKTILLSAVGRSCARCERCERCTAIRESACCLTVNHIGCDRKDRSSRLGISVGVVLLNLL